MTKKLLVVADSGRFKALRVQDDPKFSTPRLELLEDWETNVNRHLSEEVTDQSGQFRRGTPAGQRPNVQSDNEAHNLDLERRNRAARRIAQRIAELLRNEQAEELYLAMETQINKTVLAELDQRSLEKIQKNYAADLSKFTNPEIVDYFREDLIAEKPINQPASRFP